VIIAAEMSSCWFALQWPSVPHPNAIPEVHAFRTEKERDAWVAQNPTRRGAVGKRNPQVKAFRTRLEQEERHERDRKRMRDAAYTAWVWETP
jgi:hypothetical protein